MILLISLTAGCATTVISIKPPEQKPVCAETESASIFWGFQWRADQKDVADRERAAETGIKAFFQDSACFARYELQRLQSPLTDKNMSELASTQPAGTRLISLTVRELGPVLRLFDSWAVVSGGTEVMLDIAVYRLPERQPQQVFSVHWQHGGPGYIQGVASLPADIQAALTAALQPAVDKGRNPTP